MVLRLINDDCRLSRLPHPQPLSLENGLAWARQYSRERGAGTNSGDLRRGERVTLVRSNHSHQPCAS